MWSVLSKIFTKNFDEDQTCEQPPDEMDRGERKNHSETDDTYISKQAKQRASIKWLLSKAYNNKVPENIKEPFYKDHENQEHVKPQIVSGLANAEIYCRALANIYSDPNYHNLNHTAILQTLTRKGVTVTEPSDGSQMTETTLIQTNPLRMGAHMAVIESVMLLYAREVVTNDRVTAAIQRFSHGRAVSMSAPFSHEEGVLLWIQHACDALKQRVIQELVALVEKGGEGDRLKPPDFPHYRNLKDLCDGVGLAAIVAYYCPDEFHWTNIRLSLVHSVQDSLHNLRLVKEFCFRCLQASIFHLQLTDITYYQESMKLNLMVFLADLFNVMEIHPVSCVRDKFSNAIPSYVIQKKTDSLHQSQQTLASEFSEDSLRKGPEEPFLVHKGRNIPTLRSVVSEEPLIPAKYKISKEKQNYDSKADERGDIAAGKPSNWEESRKSTYAGRRSRKNSITDESQLTIENFGGSQDNLNFIGKHLDNEPLINSGRKISAPSFPVPVENAPVRSSLKDSKASFQLGYDDGCEEKQDNGTEKNRLKRQMSSDDITLRSFHDKENLFMDLVDSEIINRISFADLSKPKNLGETKGIQLVYMSDRAETPSNSSLISRLENTNSNSEKKTSFSARPNQTTWQHQVSSVPLQENYMNGVNMGTACNIMNSQLNDIRLKLEEKRRHIESEKRRMEMAMNKQRQKLGKAAFLQAVVKGRGNLLKSPENDAFGSSKEPADQDPKTSPFSHPRQPRPMTLQEVSDDATHVEKKWLKDSDSVVETSQTIDLENMDLEQYQRTLAQMNSSLSDIQLDIQRLAAEQNQMQVQHQQTMIAEQQQQVLQIQQQQQLQRQQSQPLQTHFYDSQKYQHSQSYASPLQSSSSSPHIPHFNTRVPEESQFFLHDNSKVPTVPAYRKTWGQSSIQQNPMSTNMYNTSHLPELNFWGKSHPVEHYNNNKHGFVLNHVGSDGYADSQERHKDSPGTPENRFQNTTSQRHHNQINSTSQRTPSASPRHSGNVHRQISQLLDDAIATKRQSPLVGSSAVESDSSIRAGEKHVGVIHAPVSAPSVDDMEPQNISFIGNSEDAVLTQSLSRLHITSGSRTYRIPSPTRSVHSRASPFLPLSSPPVAESLPHSQTSSLDRNPTTEKGFYISFDNDDQPKRPKPALRSKRGSPKNERSYVKNDNEASEKGENEERLNKKKQLDKQLLEEKLREEEAKRREFLIQNEREKFRTTHEDSQQSIHKVPTTSAIIIGNELSNPDPDLVDEREKKKEKIMELSLQRKQQLKDAKAKKEAEAQYKKEIEKAKKEEKERKKEEQAARRSAILEQYKLKKAIEEAERDGTTLDRQDLLSHKPTPKLRLKGPTRPRPKTIHIDSGSVQLAERLSSGGREGSLSNLTAPSTMKRDYYRGSQDSLADRSIGNNIHYKVSPDESYGRSPSHNTNQTLGRRSSYKTSRDPSPGQTRGRTKISTYQNLKGRKSNSLMNLYGSSTDQESLPYRFGDTDSGLGRATPPRRAPSPGMGLRHLPSPSGPGSLPGLMSKSRRVFDDGSSDISSTSSMMDYNGPRLYKQPATKSNRSILLNAVEYCVFPGVVNREAKRRVLEEMNKSESKHFLILFRDAGCQFRALYSYCPDTELVTKLYGTGPKQVNDKMFDTFFKYNSGGKCFSLVHTKHLTVTIDAFTIHNSLWQGKKVNLPSKKDMALVI